jgi:hypothetical protein
MHATYISLNFEQNNAFSFIILISSHSVQIKYLVEASNYAVVVIVGVHAFGLCYKGSGGVIVGFQSFGGGGGGIRATLDERHRNRRDTKFLLLLPC